MASCCYEQQIFLGPSTNHTPFEPCISKSPFPHSSPQPCTWKVLESKQSSKSPENLPCSMLFRIVTLIVLTSLLRHLLPTHGQGLAGHHHHAHRPIDTDKATLMAFKEGLSHDPYSRLASWNEETDVCNFTHVMCSKLHHRVVMINLNDSDLLGLLPPVLSNLTQLRYLYLLNNQFHGTIPHQLSSLGSLLELKLGGNNLQGLIPGSLSFLSNLRLIFLNDNNLSGDIPPSFFSNCTKLQNVDFSENQLTGRIPPEIGNCNNLWNLNLYSNQLRGEIPVSLGNATGLLSLDVENNSISGELPSLLFAKFRQIKNLHISDNNMVSHDGNTNLEPFFTELANCTDLVELEMTGMALGGSLPSSIGGLSKSLSTLQLQENLIFGPIPSEVGYLSSLTLFNLTSNLLSGAISAQIGNLTYLEQLSLSFNFFTRIPRALGKLSSLGLMDLSHNNLSGQIPEEIGDLGSINYLFLNNNLLSGKIPPSLGRCTALHTLDLSYNRLTGRVPSEISGMREMRRFINLSHNQFEGPLPVELSKFEAIEEIDLSSNSFTGCIFYQIASCFELKVLNLSNNSLQGHLPDSLGELKSLVTFDVSRNQFSGAIPRNLSQISTLTFLNLSFNNFAGTIPSGGVFDAITNLSFLGKQHLCGSVPGIPACRKKRHYFHLRLFLIIFCIVIFMSGFITTICCVIGFQRLRVIISSSQSRKVGKAPMDIKHSFPRITYKELVEATGGFDDQRLVGSGSYGRVYKGTLQDETQIAVKVLHLQSGNSTKSFNRECQVLKSIRHRNLMRIITACSLPEFKALVLPYMANGSLDSCLYPHPADGLRTGSSCLSLLQRVNICRDIAEGMAYLHHHSPVKVIHCDLKPSNVLLNDDMTALVSDFGIARLVAVGAGNGYGGMDNMGNSTVTMLCGSLGYIAPEYAFGLSTSTKGDVYSFGVLVLEMVTRKRPTDEMFVGGLSLHKYVKSHFHRQTENMVDPSLLRALREQSTEVKRMWEVAIGELIELGILCTQESPSVRPTMLDCADDLDRLKSYLRGDTTTTFTSSLGISSSTYSYD